MDTDELRDTHARLHAQLADAPQVDPESRRILADISKDIARLIETPAEPALGAFERVEEVAVRFEAGHPELAATLRRLVDLLSKAGV